ncbi:hypothetical protein KM043_009358 [Ampulex compressa]|nr:hypothetical protein KM043_009358 [Ampulex compressa]
MDVSMCNSRHTEVYTLLRICGTISNIKRASYYLFCKLGNKALLVTKNDMVYAIGENEDGCLGTGDTHDTVHATPVVRLHEKKVKTFAYGSAHVLALTEKGDVYSWGCNTYFQLGNGSSQTNPFPTCMVFNLDDNDVIVEVACGSQHCLALTKAGQVYVWGSNNCGQLGISQTAHECVPKKIDIISPVKTVVSIACGYIYSMAITDDGCLYSWGSNEFGQLGIGNSERTRRSTHKVCIPGVIRKVVCGYAHTLALTDEGILYSWGANNYGQLGFAGNESCTLPIVVSHPEMKKVLDIAASYYCNISVALEEHGCVFMWGHCAGQSIRTPLLVSCEALHDVFALYASAKIMPKPIHLQTDEEISVVESLAIAFDDASTSDLTIQVQEKSIYVHKAILKIRCQYFRTMLQGEWMENNQNIMHHDQFSYNVYKAFLKYLYTDQLNLPVEDAWELLDLANAYCEEHLKTISAQIVRRGITVENAAFLYKTAITYATKDLEDFCFKFILNHMTAVIQSSSFSNLDESTLKAFLVQAATVRAFKT